MKTRQQTAKLAAMLYIAWAGLSAAVTLTYFPAAFVVKGDAAATALRIVSSPMLYRAAVLGDLLAGVLSIYMAMALYQLFKDVDRGQARLMVAFVLLQVAMAFAIMLMQIAPLVLLNGAAYWSAFEKPQLDALALGFLSLRGQGISAMSAYWGIWLVPLGVLVSCLLPSRLLHGDDTSCDPRGDRIHWLGAHQGCAGRCAGGSAIRR